MSDSNSTQPATRRWLIVWALIAAALSACGGGDGDTPYTSARYAGDWVQATCPNGGFVRYALHAQAKTDKTMDVQLMQVRYAGANCSGASTLQALGVGRTDTVTLGEAESADGLVFQRATRTSDGYWGFNEVWTVRPDGRLCERFGASTSWTEDPILTIPAGEMAAELRARGDDWCFERYQPQTGAGTPPPAGTDGADLFGLYADVAPTVPGMWGPRVTCIDISPAPSTPPLSYRAAEEVAPGPNAFELIRPGRVINYTQAGCVGQDSLEPLTSPPPDVYQLAPPRSVSGRLVHPATSLQDGLDAPYGVAPQGSVWFKAPNGGVCSVGYSTGLLPLSVSDETIASAISTNQFCGSPPYTLGAH